MSPKQIKSAAIQVNALLKATANRADWTKAAPPTPKPVDETVAGRALPAAPVSGRVDGLGGRETLSTAVENRLDAMEARLNRREHEMKRQLETLTALVLKLFENNGGGGGTRPAEVIRPRISKVNP